MRTAGDAKSRARGPITENDRREIENFRQYLGAVAGGKNQLTAYADIYGETIYEIGSSDVRKETPSVGAIGEAFPTKQNP
jgi:hypothetical protein